MIVLAENFNEFTHVSDIARPEIGLSVTDAMPNIRTHPGESIAAGKGIDGTKAFCFCPYNPYHGDACSGGMLTKSFSPAKKAVIGGDIKWVGMNYSQEYEFFFMGFYFAGPSGLPHFCVALQNYSDNISSAFKLYVPRSYCGFWPDSDESFFTPRTETGIPVAYKQKFNRLEVELSLEGILSGKAYVRVLCNGIEFIRVDGEILSNPSRWSWDEKNENAYITRAGMFYATDRLAAIHYFYLDSLYIATGYGGYQDKPLGDYQISNIYPVEDGSQQNWQVFEDDSETSNLSPVVFQDKLFDYDGEDVDYIEASSEGERALWNFSPENVIDTRYCDIITAIHNFSWKKPYTQEEEQPYSIIPIAAMSGNEISKERPSEVLVEDSAYRLASVCYMTAPRLAVPWTWELLYNGEFGIEYHSKYIGINHDNALSFSDEAIVE